MKAGQLRHRVTLQEKMHARDGYGAVIESWQDVATVWASVEPLKGREYFAADHVNADVTGRIRMRYRAGVKPSMRVVFGARVFDIQSAVNVDERNRELELMVREVVSDG